MFLRWKLLRTLYFISQMVKINNGLRYTMCEIQIKIQISKFSLVTYDAIWCLNINPLILRTYKILPSKFQYAPLYIFVSRSLSSERDDVHQKSSDI